MHSTSYISNLKPNAVNSRHICFGVDKPIFELKWNHKTSGGVYMSNNRLAIMLNRVLANAMRRCMFWKVGNEWFWVYCCNPNG